MIQVALVLGIAGLAVLFLRNRNQLRFQAGKKILLGLFVALAVISVLFPDVVTRVANAFGVGRGTDLVLYATVIAFLFVSVNVYLKFKDYDRRLTRVARREAIAEAVERAGHGTERD